MPDLSSDLRDYFDALVGADDERAPIPLTVPAEPRRSRRAAWLAACVAAAAVIAIIGVVVDRDRDPHDGVTTADESSAPSVAHPFDEFEPGWHPLDTGPVPPMDSASLAWTGTELVVVGHEPEGSYRAFAYTPATAAWRELPPLPSAQWPRSGAPGVAWTGDELLVVEGSSPSAGAALWDPVTDTWEEIDRPLLAAPLRAVGRGGMRVDGPWGGPPALVWTGEAVLDLTNGAVWSSDSRTWSELALPDDLLPYAGLSNSTPALVDGEVLGVPWSTSPGLAWNATGTAFRHLPGVPPDIAEEGAVTDALATSLDGRVYVISGTEDGRTASLDPRAGTWRREPNHPGSSSEGCPIRVVAVADWVVARTCWEHPSTALDTLRGVSWESIDPTGDACCDWHNAAWTDAGGVLISWSTSTDFSNDLDAPNVRAGIWIPPERNGSGSDTPPTRPTYDGSRPEPGEIERVPLRDWAVAGGTVPQAAPTPFEYRRDGSGRILASLIDGRTMAIDAELELRLSDRTPRVDTTAAYVDTGDAFALTVLWGTIEQNFGGRPILRVIDRGPHGGLLLGGTQDIRLVVEIEGWTVALSANDTPEDRQNLIVEALDGGAEPLTGFLRLTSDTEVELDYTNIDDTAGYLGPVLRLTNGDPGIRILPARCDRATFESTPDGGYAARCDPTSDTEVSAQLDGTPGAAETVDGINVTWLE
ncbi:MAG: hypothetical protein ACXIVQ_16235 [Acidimicrobiales bacterium]